MGSACCVAARSRTIRNGTASNEAFHRAIRYSPSWSYRWDNRGRVASDEDYPMTDCSRGTWRNTGSNAKGGRDVEFSYISDGGSPVENFQTPTMQLSPSDLSEVKNFHAEVKNSAELSAVVYPPVASTTLVPKFDPLSSQSHPHPDDSIPSKRAYNSPARQHFKKISDERIPELASPSTSIHAGRRSYATSTFSNYSGLSSRGGSSDIWSMLAFSELAASSNLDRWSFDSKALDIARGSVIESNNRHLASPAVDTSVCGVCSKLLTDRSLLCDQILGNNELSVVAVLVCGHVYHAECLEGVTPETEAYDPACPLCINGKQSSMGHRKKLKNEAFRKARSRRSRSQVMNGYPDFESWDGDLKHRRRSRREEKHDTISSASGSIMKSSFAKPFLKRHFSLGTKSAKSVPENDSLTEVPGKKGFWGRRLKE